MRPSVRCYHEAGHALLAMLFGAVPKTITADPEFSRTDHGDAYSTLTDREQALIALGGGVAEELEFSERSPGCCFDDLKKFEGLAPGLTRVDQSHDELLAELEREVRETLNRPPMRQGLEVLAAALAKSPLVAGAWAIELVLKACPSLRGPFMDRRSG
jgi:hypothetical protein